MGFGNLISADILAEKRLKKVHHDDKKEKKEKSSVLHAEPSKSPSTVKTKAPATVRKHCSKASSCPSSLVFGLSQNNPFSWLISWDLKSLTSIAFSFPQSAKSRPAPPVPQCPPSKHLLQAPISTYKFSTLSSIYISMTNQLRECVLRSKHFLLSDHFINSHKHFCWQHMDTVRRNLMLITPGTN